LGFNPDDLAFALFAAGESAMMLGIEMNPQQKEEQETQEEDEQKLIGTLPFELQSFITSNSNMGDIPEREAIQIGL
jgi:hypothetical protein